MSAVLDDVRLDDEVKTEAETEKLMRLAAFGLNLQMKRTAAIKARSSSGVERRWIADTDAYHGRDAMNRASDLMSQMASGSTGQSPDRKQTQRRSTQFVQKTRQKTNTAAAHLSDILFPSDDKNWALRPTPVPELMSILKNRASDPMVEKGQVLMHPQPGPDGQPRPLTQGDVATDLMKVAREKCDRMAAEIDDQLTECNYNTEGRKVIEDAAQLGTGVLRGPVAVTRTKRSWVRKKGKDGKSYYDAEIKLDTEPASNRVDPWNCFPAPGCGEDIHKGAFFWEKEIISPMALKELAKADGFDEKQIRACLAEAPARAREADHTSLQGMGEGQYLDTGILDTSNYELWLYWGEVDRDDWIALGNEVDKKSELQTVSAAVVMCNDRVIRSILNPSDMGDIPYDFYIWERMTGSPWGVGLPYLMRYTQAAMNAAWRQMQDNAGASYGAQIVMRRKGIQPADGTWDIYGNKIWFAMDDSVDVDKAFAMHHIDNRQESLEAIFQIANQLADDETAMPQLMQGDQGEAPDKVGVARILVNGASVMLKRYARNWDDRVTSPHLRRYYDWNMQYNDNEEIKGDYFVQALGSTHLVVKDQMAQDIANSVAMAANPLFTPFFNPEKLAEKQVQYSACKDVLFTREELEENRKKAEAQPPPSDPRIEAAKIQATTAGEVAKLKAEGEIRAEQVEAQSEIKNQELRMIEAARNDERELAKLQLEFDLAVLKMAQESKQSIQDIRLQLAMKTMDLQAQQQQQVQGAAIDAGKQAQAGEQKQQELEFQSAAKQQELREQGNQKLTERAQEQMGKFEEEKRAEARGEYDKPEKK